jgi:RNA polymerase sigma factor (sigma-70 family)
MLDPKYDGLIEGWKVDMITKRAKRYGFSDDDIPDLKQRIVPELINADFDPDKQGGAKESTFVIEVIDRQLKKVLRGRNRNVRKANYEADSIEDENVITQKSYFKKNEAERTELRIDLEKVMTGLSAEEKKICMGFMTGDSQADLAREMGRSKAAVSNAVAKLREKFKKWGFDIY